MSDLIRQILKTTTYRPLDVEAVLDLKKVSWCTFDPEIGYFPRNVVLKDGMDFCFTTYTYEPTGQRKMINYSDQPCRINTYGDSFTQSQQVSDDESWQERLAAHIGEPIRNFGIGGHSVFTACKRAMKMEVGECSAKYILLTIYDDDHVRNLDASRWIRTQWNDRDRPRDRAWPLHGLPGFTCGMIFPKDALLKYPAFAATGRIFGICVTRTISTKPSMRIRSFGCLRWRRAVKHGLTTWKVWPKH